MSSKPCVVIGMSGGVDSSVAAWLLKQQGYQVIGLFMKNWEGDDNDEYCSARQDWLDVVAVADLLEIDVEAVNFATEYKDRVFAEFLREYSAGRTPNPDILCNAEIKFKAFLDHALSLGAQYIATGHYARVSRAAEVLAHTSGQLNRLLDEQVVLRKGADPSKDQSYFLHRLSQAQLARTLFPLGEINKTMVRKLADDLGLPNARKKDSTGICFIGERPFRAFLNRYLPTQAGPIKNERGQTIGEHIGLAFYTLGQRKGIGIGGQRDSNGGAWYVARKELSSNTLYVVQNHEHPWLLQQTVHLENVSWVAGTAPTQGLVCSAKTRYRQADAACEITAIDATTAQLYFQMPQWAVTPGQSAVLYDGDICLGGGVIV